MSRKKTKSETGEQDDLLPPVGGDPGEGLPIAGPPADAFFAPGEHGPNLAAPSPPLPDPILASLSSHELVLPHPAPVAPIIAIAPVAAPLPNQLDERLRHLEEVLASLQGLQGMEQRLGEQIKRATPSGPSLLDTSKQLLNLMPSPALSPRPASNSTWLLFDSIAELRCFWRMFIDPRYQLSWFGRLVPLALVACFFLTGYLPFADIPIVGWILRKLAELLIAYVLFKVLAYEARRYRETAPDLPPSLRL